MIAADYPRDSHFLTFKLRQSPNSKQAWAGTEGPRTFGFSLAFVSLAAFTGMRRSEILSLRWLHVDLQNCRLMLRQTKNGDGRIIYLNKLAASVIDGQWSQGMKPADRVFPLADDCTPDNISKGFAAVCRRLEIEDFHFHDLRHTAASWLRMAPTFTLSRSCSDTEI